MDVQVLPMVADVIKFSIQVRFFIKEQGFTQEEMRILDVLPSKQRVSRHLIATAPPKDTKTILLVSSSPQDKVILRSDREITNILFELKHSAPKREGFEAEVLLAATMDDLSKRVIYLRPYLIHFSGHGSQWGILLENADEEAKLMPTAALLALLKPLSDQVACVILNACETLDSAKELAQCIPYVIGMRQEILDPAAIAFSKGFYEAIGAGHPIETSFEFGRARVVQDYFEETRNPVLFKQGKAM
jgi:hypothetical protein